MRPLDMHIFRIDLARLTIAAVFTIVPVIFLAPISADEPKSATPAPASNAAPTTNAEKEPAAKELTFKEGSPWKPSHFGGDGTIEMNDGVLKLGFGDPLTGVRWEGDFPKNNYEVTLEARRVGGFDFFCALTLPVADQHFSLVLGGWGGSLVGLSSIDGLDASNNETMLIRDFKKDQWYKAKVRVTDKQITVWLDDESIIEVAREGRVFDVRSEMLESVPLGVAAFQSEAEIRKLQVRTLDPVVEVKKAEASAPQ
jgi:hypothetical protein